MQISEYSKYSYFRQFHKVIKGRGLDQTILYLADPKFPIYFHLEAIFDEVYLIQEKEIGLGKVPPMSCDYYNLFTSYRPYYHCSSVISFTNSSRRTMLNCTAL